MPDSVFFIYLFLLETKMKFGWCRMKQNSGRGLWLNSKEADTASVTPVDN